MKLVLCVRVCSVSAAVTSGFWKILMLSMNVGMKSSASAFSLELLGTLLWVPVHYLRGCMFIDIVNFWKLLSGLFDGVPLAVRQRLWFQHDGAPAHWGRSLAVVDHDVSRNMDWMFRADCIASLVAGGHLKEYVSVVTPSTLIGLMVRLKATVTAVRANILRCV